jgi:hypothetical protein
MKLRFALAISLLAFSFENTAIGQANTPGTTQNFQLVGHNSLFGRGLNAAPAIFDHFLYVGNRTDGSSTCGVGDPRGPGANCPHPHPGILILDIVDPSDPTIVGEIGPPFAGNVGITTRELRVWPLKKLLMVMSFRCSAKLHACPPGTDVTFPFDIKFFDLTDPLHPGFILSYVTTSNAGQQIKPHEMYLWIDPKNPDRALLWQSTPTLSTNPARPNLVIADISKVPSGGPVVEVAEGNWNQFFPGADTPANYDFDLALHSMAPTTNGRRTNLAYLRGGYGTLETGDVADNGSPGQVISLNDKLLSPVPSFARWGAGNVCAGGTSVGCSESHSAVPVLGRPFELNTDEVYGTFTDPSFGWPWGWARLISLADPERPSIVGEFKTFQNTDAFQPSVDPDTQQFTSYSSHNPTVTRNLAFIAWHSAGLQAIDLSNPAAPVQAGHFSPEPLDEVANEDPALSRGPNKVVMWSYPIIRNGLIYVVDIRNGLFVLRYTGPNAAEVNGIGFLEGNSNLGDAVQLDQSSN